MEYCVLASVAPEDFQVMALWRSSQLRHMLAKEAYAAEDLVLSLSLSLSLSISLHTLHSDTITTVITLQVSQQALAGFRPYGTSLKTMIRSSNSSPMQHLVILSAIVLARHNDTGQALRISEC